MSDVTGHFSYFSFSFLKAVSSHVVIHNGSLKLMVSFAVMMPFLERFFSFAVALPSSPLPVALAFSHTT